MRTFEKKNHTHKEKKISSPLIYKRKLIESEREFESELTKIIQQKVKIYFIKTFQRFEKLESRCKINVYIINIIPIN